MAGASGPSPDDGTAERVLVVGAGLAGLTCARLLHQHDVPVSVLDAADQPGGRVRTDQVDGFLLDRGFQVLLAAAPQAQELLDYERLELCRFRPQVALRHRGRFTTVADPFQTQGLRGRGIGLGDRRDLAGLCRRVTRGTLEELLARPETSAAEALAAAGVSEALVRRLLRPLLGGLLLDPDLGMSSRLLEFTVRLLVDGDLALPAHGMGAIPAQLAAGLPPEVLQLDRRVTAVAPGSALLASGERLTGRAVVVATDGPAAAALLDGLPAPGSLRATTVYFAAEDAPVDAGVVVVDGDHDGPIAQVWVPSLVAPAYAPDGAHLIAVTVLGEDAARPPAELESALLAQLADWFGAGVVGWRQLASYHLPHALPAQPPGSLDPPARPARLADDPASAGAAGAAEQRRRAWPRVYLCGDHRDLAGHHGAMASGRRAAQAVLDDLAGSAAPPGRGSIAG